MIKIWTLIILTLKVAFSIKFDYKAAKHQFICFHQQLEKQTRFQVMVKADAPTFSMQLFQQDKSIYEDDREQVYIKQYSAFSRIDGVLLICLANKAIDNSINYQIQFYHGLHLDQFSSSLDQNAFIQYDSIAVQIFRVQEFIKSGYQMNVKTLIDRNNILSSMPIIISIMTFVTLIVLMISRLVLVTRLKKMLRARKLI